MKEQVVWLLIIIYCRGNYLLKTKYDFEFPKINTIDLNPLLILL